MWQRKVAWCNRPLGPGRDRGLLQRALRYAAGLHRNDVLPQTSTGYGDITDKRPDHQEHHGRGEVQGIEKHDAARRVAKRPFRVSVVV
jgi:hypothetical protein